MGELNINTNLRDEETGEEIFCATLHEFIIRGLLFGSWIVDGKRMVRSFLMYGEVRPENEMDCGDCPLGGEPCDPFSSASGRWIHLVA